MGAIPDPGCYHGPEGALVCLYVCISLSLSRSLGPFTLSPSLPAATMMRSVFNAAASAAAAAPIRWVMSFNHVYVRNFSSDHGKKKLYVFEILVFFTLESREVSWFLWKFRRIMWILLTFSPFHVHYLIYILFLIVGLPLPNRLVRWPPSRRVSLPYQENVEENS